MSDRINTNLTSSRVDRVVVDVSNVAWAGMNSDLGEEPAVDNIKIMIDALDQRNIVDITYIAKANLRYLIDDRETFDQLLKDKIIELAPSGSGKPNSNDDDFILRQAIRTDSLIVSNDGFHDWKQENPDLKDKIDALRTTFRIHNGEVDFNEKLDDWLSAPSQPGKDSSSQQPAKADNYHTKNLTPEQSDKRNKYIREIKELKKQMQTSKHLSPREERKLIEKMEQAERRLKKIEGQ